MVSVEEMTVALGEQVVDQTGRLAATFSKQTGDQIVCVRNDGVPEIPVAQCKIKSVKKKKHKIYVHLVRDREPETPEARNQRGKCAININLAFVAAAGLLVTLWVYYFSKDEMAFFFCLTVIFVTAAALRVAQVRGL